MPYELKIINESAFSSLDSKDIDKENKVIRNISLLGTTSRNNRLYTKAALESAANILEGAPAFYVHSYKQRNAKKELIGKFTDLKVIDNRVKGTLNVLEKEAPFIFDLAERMPELAGFSIDATVKYRREGKKEIIEGFLKRKSVDLVTDPATVQGLFESTEEIEESEDFMTEAEVKKIQESLVTQNDQIKTLTESLKKERLASKEALEKSQAKVTNIERDNLVIKKIQESKLPGRVITELFRNQLINAKDEDAIDELLKDRKEILESSLTSIIKKSQDIDENTGKVTIKDVMEEIKNN